MIIDLPDTTTTEISKRLIALRSEVGSMALTRVLTLVLVVDESEAEASIETANAASRQHPCRIIVLVLGNKRGAARLDAQIRVGGDAGASEVVVCRLYGELTGHGRSVLTPLLLPDCPIVAWWPGEAPRDPAKDPIGEIAQRRITDSARTRGLPRTVLSRLARTYAAGDTDLAWSRITLWRGLLAAALDQAPFESVSGATVSAGAHSPSGDLLAAWLADRLKIPVTLTRSRTNEGIVSVTLDRASGPLELSRPAGAKAASLTQPGQPERLTALAHRTDAECLADELRRLDPDETYADALRRGLAKVSASRRRTPVKEGS